MTARRATGISATGLLLALALLAGCRSQYVQEPWTGGAGERTKQGWLSPPTPQQLDQMRTRLSTSQSDH